jgi:hypothetical protein
VITDRHAQGGLDRRGCSREAGVGFVITGFCARDYDVRIVDTRSDYGLSVKVDMPLYSADIG